MKRLMWIMICVSVLAIACDSDNSTTTQSPVAPASETPEGTSGAITFKVTFAPWWNIGSAKMAAIEAIDSIVAYVYDSADAEIAEEAMEISGGKYSGQVTILAQDDLRVALVFYDGDIVRYIGEDTDVDVPAGGETTAEIIEEYIGTTVASPETADAGTEYVVSWSERPYVTEYQLQESTESNFSGAATVYEGTATSTTRSQTVATTYYYRARVNTGYGYGPWHSTGDASTGIEAAEGTIVIGGDVPPDVPSILTMVSIPGGTFQMGDIQGGGDSHEQPVHTVTVSGFEMSIYEVTQEQYETIMGENPSFFSGTNLPVETVSWYDAVTFCNNLSSSEGLQTCYNQTTCDFTKNGYRLPTEAEWEYACRAGTTTNYYTGNNESDLANAGWYTVNSGSTTHPVGQKTPNAWGLYDMHGNVWEWCNDKYSSDYYSISSTINPTGSTSGSPIVRGGTWDNDSSLCRSAWRNRYGITVKTNGFGFRVVRRP